MSTFIVLSPFICISGGWCHCTWGNTYRFGTVAHRSVRRYPYRCCTAPVMGSSVLVVWVCRCFTAAWELAYTQISRAEKRQKKIRDSVMHWVRGMPNCNHLWWYNHSSVKPPLHSHISPLSYHYAAHPHCLSDMSETGNLTLESQVSTSSEESLSVQEFLFQTNLRVLSPF